MKNMNLRMAQSGEAYEEAIGKNNNFVTIMVGSIITHLIGAKNAVYHLNHNRNFKHIITKSMSEQLEITEKIGCMPQQEKKSFNAFHFGFAAPKLLIHSPHIFVFWAGKAMTYSIS
jgi:hypothetical protein